MVSNVYNLLNNSINPKFRKMKSLILALTTLIFTINSYSQYGPSEDLFLNATYDFYSANYLNTESSGRGFTGIGTLNDISGIALNPATFNVEKKYQLNVQYTYKTKHTFNYGYYASDYAIKHQLFSGSIGFGYRINKSLQTGIVYNNPNGMYFDLGEGIRTDEFGNELSRYDFYYNVVRHSINIPLKYTSGNFSAAINANYIYNILTIPGEAVTTISSPDGYQNGDDFKATANWFKCDAGFLVQLDKTFSLGLSVSTGMRSTVTYKYPDGTNEYSMSTLPWKAGIGGFYYFPNSTWKIGVDYVYQRTSDMKYYKTFQYYKDRHDVHLGAEGNISKEFILRAGVFTAFDYRKEAENITYTDKIGEYDQYFLTFGGTYKTKSVRLNLAVLTSQLSPGKYQGLYINGGVTYDF